MKLDSSSAIDQLFWRIILKDDKDAFQSLFFEFFSSLCVFAHRYIDDWSTCEDLVQDTFYTNMEKKKIDRNKYFEPKFFNHLCQKFLH